MLINPINVSFVNFHGLNNNIDTNKPSLHRIEQTDFNERKPIEQHFHGAFGVNFSDCSVDDVKKVARKMKEIGVDGILPTLVTDSPENIKKQISVIKKAADEQSDDMAKIYGVHLEGIFLNPDKCGIHDKSLFMKPTIENYKKIEDPFIKIVTLAPELDENHELSKYLLSKGVKVQAGHCKGKDLSDCTGVTHLFNAMSNSHRGDSTATSALINDDIYTEVIADGVHLSDDTLRLIFKTKPIDKILIVSDCLTLAGIPPEECNEFEFAGSTIYNKGKIATSKDGTIAGSLMLLPDAYKHLKEIGLYSPQLITNTYNYLGIDTKKSSEKEFVA